MQWKYFAQNPGHEGVCHVSCVRLTRGMRACVLSPASLRRVSPSGPRAHSEMEARSTSTSRLHLEYEYETVGPLSSSASPERRPGRVVVVIDHALDILHQVLLNLDISNRTCVVHVALVTPGSRRVSHWT